MQTSSKYPQCHFSTNTNDRKCTSSKKEKTDKDRGPDTWSGSNLQSLGSQISDKNVVKRKTKGPKPESAVYTTQTRHRHLSSPCGFTVAAANQDNLKQY